MTDTTFTCERCHYSTHRKCMLRRHLGRKLPCQPTYSDEKLDVLLQKLSDDKPYKCTVCNKGFTTRQGRSQHKKCCKGKAAHEPLTQNMDENTDMMKLICELRDEMKVLRQQAIEKSSTTNNIQVNHITNNQVINTFGREDTSHLTDKFLNTCLRRTSKGFVQLLEKLHWDPSVPENANIRISNRKMPLAEIQESGKWRFVPRDKAINQMIDKGQGILSEHFEDHQEEIKANVSDSLWDHLCQWMEKMQDKDKSTIQDLLLEIYCLILNNS